MLKIQKEKRSSLLGHTEVVLSLVVDGKPDCGTMIKVLATPHGISFTGDVTDHHELEYLAKMVSMGWNEFQELKPRIASTLSGH